MPHTSRTGSVTTVRTAATGIAVAVAVAGAAFSGQWLSSGDGPPAAPIADAPAPVPVPAPAPVSQAPSAAPTTTSPAPSMSAIPPPSTGSPAATRPVAGPAPAASSPAAPTIPASVPSRVFLQPAELNDREGAKDSTGEMLPVMCRTDLSDGYRAGVRRTKFAVFRNETTPLDNVVDGALRHTVTVHGGDGAVEFMSGLRAAVAACSEDTVKGKKHEYRLADGGGVGDDSILVQRRSEELEPGDPTEKVWRIGLISAVRVGDAVTVVDAAGYEGTDVTRATMADLTDAAYRHLDDWR